MAYETVNVMQEAKSRHNAAFLVLKLGEDVLWRARFLPAGQRNSHRVVYHDQLAILL